MIPFISCGLLGIIFPDNLREEKQFCGRTSELLNLVKAFWGEEGNSLSCRPIEQSCFVVCTVCYVIVQVSIRSDQSTDCPAQDVDQYTVQTALSIALCAGIVIHQLHD